MTRSFFFWPLGLCCSSDVTFLSFPVLNPNPAVDLDPGILSPGQNPHLLIPMHAEDFALVAALPWLRPFGALPFQHKNAPSHPFPLLRFTGSHVPDATTAVVAPAQQSIRTAGMSCDADHRVGVPTQRHGRDGGGAGAWVDERDVTRRGACCEEVEGGKCSKGEQGVGVGARVNEGLRGEIPGADSVIHGCGVGNGGVCGGEDDAADWAGVGFEKGERTAL